MFKAKIEIKFKDLTADYYNFSDDDKDRLFLNATSWFCGYVQGCMDGGIKTRMLYTPSVMSIDGFQAWDKKHELVIKLVNENDKVIAKVDDII